MSSQTNPPQKSMPSAAARQLQNVCQDVYRGFIHTTQNSMALLGLLLAVVLVVFGARADLRQTAEERLLTWLLERQSATQLVERDVDVEPSAVERVTAADIGDLTEQQAKVTQWLSRKYRVAPEPLAALVSEAYQVGERSGLDPALILAVMAIESRFNPFAQSPVGAQGLMQVLTRVHTDKYEDFGGELAAFDPMSNLRVGVRVLQDAVKRAGSVEGGLRLYVGAVTTDGAWYIDRVMAERQRIHSVALGKPMQRYIPTPRPTPVSDPAAAPAAAAAAIEAEAPLPLPTPSNAALRS